MPSLQIGSSDGSHGLTQHGPSHSHLPTPSASSQTRKRRRATEFNPSAIRTDSEASRQLSVACIDWHNDDTDQIPSSLSLLLDWLSISGNYDSLKGKGGSKPQDGYKRASAYLKERGCTTSLTPPGIRSKVNGKAPLTPSFGMNNARGWKDGTGNGQGQYIIDHAPIDRHVGAERDAMGEQVINTISNLGCSAGLSIDNIRMICPEWDILHLIFSDQDGGSIALRSDSTQANNLVLQALQDEPFNSLQSQLPASTGLFGFTQTSPTLLLQHLLPSIQSSPTALSTAQAGPSQYYDFTHVHRAVRLETHSVSNRHNGRATDDAESIFSKATQGFLNSEAEWGNRKTRIGERRERGASFSDGDEHGKYCHESST
nr:hypothetical protein L203_02577 [Cryptococcus depauperatus CBS 7841]